MLGADPYIGQVLDEKYQLERLLGRGGMGAVYLATHLGTERYVALKLITPQFMRNEEFVARFKREARAAGRLRHPNVVDVTDFGFAHAGGEAVAYLVMEYLDGCTLGDILCCLIGFIVARRLGLRRSLVVFAVLELVLIIWIKDSLLLEILMLVVPIDAVRSWQMCG